MSKPPFLHALPWNANSSLLRNLLKGHSYLRVDLKLLERAFRSLTLFTTSFFTLPYLETCSTFPSFRLCSSPYGMPFFLLPQLLGFGLPIKDQTFTISQCFTMTELSTCVELSRLPSKVRLFLHTYP